MFSSRLGATEDMVDAVVVVSNPMNLGRAWRALQQPREIGGDEAYQNSL